MTTKGETSRLKILKAAHTLFSKKGYCAVTMKDITDATGFSRGGLYRHFSSTEDIFLELIETEQKKALAALEDAIEMDLHPDTIIHTFLFNRMKKICSPEKSFDNAVSEFAANSEKGLAALRRRAEISIRILTRLIENGNSKGCFSCDNPLASAEHILWLMEGISKHSSLFDVDDNKINEQVVLLEKILK